MWFLHLPYVGWLKQSAVNTGWVCPSTRVWTFRVKLCAAACACFSVHSGIRYNMCGSVRLLVATWYIVAEPCTLRHGVCDQIFQVFSEEEPGNKTRPKWWHMELRISLLRELHSNKWNSLCWHKDKATKLEMLITPLMQPLCFLCA